MNEMQIEDISVGLITIVACRMPDGRDGWALPGGSFTGRHREAFNAARSLAHMVDGHERSLPESFKRVDGIYARRQGS